jgi:hypothetical protein
LIFLVVSFPLAFPPIIYKRSSSPPIVLHGPPISTSTYFILIILGDTATFKRCLNKRDHCKSTTPKLVPAHSRK